MAFCLHFLGGLGIVNDRDESVSIPPDIEDHVAIDIIGILKHLPYFGEIVPANRLNDACPGFYFTCCIWVLLHRFAQMPAGNDIHSLNIFHNS